MNQIRRADRRTSKLKYPLEAMRGNKTNRLRNGYENEMEMVAACVLKYSKLYSYRSVLSRLRQNDKSE